jgi:hypothetical protein
MVVEQVKVESHGKNERQFSVGKKREHGLMRDSAGRIATSYGLDGRKVGVRVPVEVRIFISPCRPDRIWGPPSLLPNGYGGLFLRK